MPRKSKITAVPVDQPEGLVVASTQEDEKTDAQEMTDIINEVKSDEAEPVVEQAASLEPEAKAKPKRASKAKAKASPLPEPVVDVIPSLDETVAEVELPNEEPKDAKAVDKVTCPDCGKRMSAKTLKYSHVPNCLVKKQAQTDWSDAVQTAKEARDEGSQSKVIDYFSALDQVPEDVLEKKYVERKATTRMAKREKALEKLITNAF